MISIRNLHVLEWQRLFVLALLLITTNMLAAGTVDNTFIRGDSNRDASVNIADAVNTLTFLFNDSGPLPCVDAADANDDGSVDIADPVATLAVLFGSTITTLPPPYPGVGEDPTPDALFCDPLLADAATELATILTKFPSFSVVPVQSGTTTLLLTQSLVVDDIRGVEIDETPPTLQGPAYVSPASMVDGFAPGQAPYDAAGILPFDFRYYTNANSYQGWHTWNMAEYAATHGFGQTDPYNSTASEWSHLPAAAELYTWSGWNWATWMSNNGYASGRYDTLPSLQSLTTSMLGESFFYASWNDAAAYSNSMADMEHSILSPSSLQSQAWYPSGGTQAEKDQFESDYYEGYANTNICWMHVAEQRNWTGYGMYGWQPFARQWFGLDTATGDPATDWRWSRFGSVIYDEVEVLYPSVYCFYWNSRNLAYMLANIDLNATIIAGKAVKKPTMPYVWPLLHGGGGGWRWWRYQPLPDQDMQAIGTSIFFSDIIGFVLWGWSGTGDPHRVTLAVDDNHMVETPFTAAETATPTQTRDFVRYDVIHVTAIDGSDNVDFKYIDKGDPNGSLAAPTTYTMQRSLLETLLRPETANMDALIEGMALARVFEFFLWHGSIEVDVPATEQWAQNLPVVRRVRLGQNHVVVAYDPFAATYPAGRTVTLTDFAGSAGSTLTIPVDGTVRVWMLQL
ncbi:MAG: hypothetical protein AAF581_13530 [Planctomycetota bacterium]